MDIFQTGDSCSALREVILLITVFFLGQLFPVGLGVQNVYPVNATNFTSVV